LKQGDDLPPEWKDWNEPEISDELTKNAKRVLDLIAKSRTVRRVRAFMSSAVLRACFERMVAEVIIVAVVRKIITILNFMVRNNTVAHPKATRVLPRVSGKASAANTTIRYAPPAIMPIASPSGIVLLR